MNTQTIYYFFVLILAFSVTWPVLLLSVPQDLEVLIEAIDRTDIETVQKLLAEKPISAQDKQEMLAVAQTVIKLRQKATASLFSSTSDTIEFGIGALLTYWGAKNIRQTIIKTMEKNLISAGEPFISNLSTLLAPLNLFFGPLLLYESLHLTNAHMLLNRARKIKKAIEQTITTSDSA